MSTTLYRKYRPQTFAEIVGQKPVVQTLSNAVKHNRIGQAYLFAGPRGTGKTTLARIFAKAVNCANLLGKERDASKLSIRRSPAEAGKNPKKDFEPCNQCDICKNINEGRSLDIIEIDAASNTGVDNIRELRETVKLPPTQARFKVYIIDEAHMLSTGAFNALLKTLEEPPAHVIFILATTAIHKIPETIISRCQRFDFARLSLEQIIKKLSFIANQEKIEIEKNALEMIALAAEGGMRDAESLLAQIISFEDKSITSKEVEEILGTTGHQSVEKMAGFILEKNAAGALSLINKLSDDGVNLEVFYKSLLNYLRQLMLVSVDLDLAHLFSLELTAEQIKTLELQAHSSSSQEILHIINCLIETRQTVRFSFIPQLPLELAVIKATQEETISNKEKAESREYEKGNMKQEAGIILPACPSCRRDGKAGNQELEVKSEEARKRGVAEKISNERTEIPADLTIELVESKWNELLREIRKYNHSLVALLSNCQPVEIKENKIIIATRYIFYKDKLNESKSRMRIEEVLEKILGAKVTTKFVTEEEAGIKIGSKKQEESAKRGSKDNPLLDEAMKIMGGRLVGDPPETGK
ncbi:MAG: DNA polymerase III subunit gamma/tau [Candidatus Moranbacteria bacterium]|nr:DNA polymerase III subunit gamma/tau [Candidatus Moranbacteria bacterium]